MLLLSRPSFQAISPLSLSLSKLAWSSHARHGSIRLPCISLTFRAALTDGARDAKHPQTMNLLTLEHSPFVVEQDAQDQSIRPLECSHELGLEDNNLDSTWMHRVWVGAGCAAIGGVGMKAIMAVISGCSVEEACVAVLSVPAAYVLADFSTGVFHWAIDNYADANSPLFGGTVDAAQGHHRRPWTITRRQFANNTHSLARGAALGLLPIFLLPSCTPGYVYSFFAVLSACVMLSQQCHAWAHAKRENLPVLVVTMQDVGLLLSTENHALHHSRRGYRAYCIVSGLWNALLDGSNFFSLLERFVYDRSGWKPRSWSTETSTMEWSSSSYYTDGTDHFKDS